jgi:hypothetical protein
LMWDTYEHMKCALPNGQGGGHVQMHVCDMVQTYQIRHILCLKWIGPLEIPLVFSGS